MFTNAEVPAFSAVMLSPEYQGEEQRAAWCSSFHPALEHPYIIMHSFKVFVIIEMIIVHHWNMCQLKSSITSKGRSKTNFLQLRKDIAI